MQHKTTLKVMVLAGGPDRERPVSLQSGQGVAAGLEAAGHDVRMRDVTPDDLSCLDEFNAWGGDVIFPVLHGPWGEGGPLQAILDERNVRYVGCRQPAARLCMDKHETKRVLAANGQPTPPFELIAPDGRPTMRPPVVVKALREGSSIGMAICPDQTSLDQAFAELQPVHRELLVEKFVAGYELTVGVIEGLSGSEDQPTALPPIRIVPATAFYDYQAKYQRDDTRYLFDAAEMGISQQVLEGMRETAAQAHKVLGCRHLCRVDFMFNAEDRDDQEAGSYVIEVNTMPGFTTHSLLPKAAARAGLEMAKLTDHLVQLAMAQG